MNLLRRIGNAMVRFMYGRNGMDQLGLCTVWLMVAVNVAGLLFHRGLPGAALRTASAVLALCAIYRILSRNLQRRRAENAAFLNRVWYPMGRRLGRGGLYGDKEHRFFACGHCRAVCRVPKGKGNIIITCPRCGNQIRARS